MQLCMVLHAKLLRLGRRPTRVQAILQGSMQIHATPCAGPCNTICACCKTPPLNSLTWIGPPHEGWQAEGDEGGHVDSNAAVAQPRDELVEGRSAHGGNALWVGDDAAYQGAPTPGAGGGQVQGRGGGQRNDQEVGEWS